MRRVLLIPLALVLFAGCRKATEADAPPASDPAQAARLVKDSETNEMPAPDPVKPADGQPPKPDKTPPVVSVIPQPPPPPVQPVAEYMEDVFGQLGPQRSEGDAEEVYESRGTYWQKGKRVCLLGAAEYPDQPLAPVFFVLVQKRPDDDDNPGGGTKVDQEFSSNEIYAHAGKGPMIYYAVLNDPQKEIFSMGSERFSLAAGRVFLLDQTVGPPTVQQIKVDLTTLFGSATPSKEAFTAAIAKLRKEQPPVEGFLSQMEKK
jgi:hypothetical protein